MASPFPGMNPYLEQPDVWHEFREAMCHTIMAELARALPDPYYVRGDATVYIREEASADRRAAGRPDVFVSGPDRDGGHAGGAASVAAPARTLLPEVDTFAETTIEIHDSRRRRVVTAIELLSPSNKDPNDDYRRYAGKRLAYLRAGASLVEVDLLRGGTRPRTIRPLPPADYYVLIARPDQRPAAAVWPVRLHQPLPEIPVPLAPPDPDVRLDLQRVLHAAYDARSFGKFVYNGRPDPPLPDADADWARELLAQPSAA